MAITLDIQSHISGDTWQGIDSLALTNDGSPIDLTDAYIEMNVRYQIDSPLVLQFNSNVTTPFLSAGYGQLNILSPAISGLIQVPPQTVNIPPATYIYSIKVQTSNEVETFYIGNWTITKTA